MTLVLLTLTAAFGLTTWLNPRGGLLLLVALLPSYLLRTELFGVPTTLLELLLLTFVVLWTIKHRPAVSDLLPTRNILAPLVLLIAAATISLFVAPDLMGAAGIWKAYFIEPILLFFIVRYELIHAGITAEDLFKSLGLTALILSLVAIFQWITGAGLPIPWDIERRVTSVFDYPNALGLFLGPIVIIGGIHTRRVSKDISTWFWPAVTILSLIATALAQSEAAIVAIMATLLLAGLVNKNTRRLTVAGTLALGALVLLSPWRADVVGKLTLQDYSGQVRLSQWSETMNLLQDRWLLGTGLSGYPTALEPYHQATHYEIFQYPHNIILNIWVELGLLGFIAVALLGWQLLARGRSIKLASLAEYAALFALIEIAIHGLVDVPYLKNDLAILTWLLIAILLYAPQTHRSQK